ncbi:MAG: c-type cytochrome domain-containing protein [Planctomycetota bacterium]
MRGSSLLVVMVCMAAVSAAARAVDFAHEVVPLLKKHCGQCHTGDAKQGGFSMNTREDTLAGGDSGTPGFVEGAAAASELIARITSGDPDYRMPSAGDPLPPEAVAVLRQWIDAKAPWEDGFAFKGTGWEPPLLLRTVALPPAEEGRTNPVDRVVDAYWRERGIGRPPRSDDETFIRRVSLDLVGLSCPLRSVSRGSSPTLIRPSGPRSSASCSTTSSPTPSTG